MSNRPKLLDLFCCAGGAAMGYHLAGFDVTGVDIKPQKRYPFEFVLGDALEYATKHAHQFDVIHASPPCQAFSVLTPTQYKANHPNLIDSIRQILLTSGKPYVIENVSGARKLLHDPLMLCGTMLGLPIYRHRYFEIKPDFYPLLPGCSHSFAPVLVSGHTKRYKKIVSKSGSASRIEKGKRFSGDVIATKREAMECQWMTSAEITEAIPPAYTEFIGKYLLTVLNPASIDT